MDQRRESRCRPRPASDASTKISSTSGSPAQIQVSSKTWVKCVSTSLFDFQASGADVQSESYAVSGAGACVRTGGRASCGGAGKLARIQQMCEDGSKSKFLFKVEVHEQQIALTPAESASNRSRQKSRPWVVVKESPSRAAKISVGDEILMGRASLIVAQVVADGRSSEAPRVWEQSVCESCDPGASDSMQCRICLMDGGSEENPFVQPCLCRGSVANVHLSCLRQWTKTRLQLSEVPLESFAYKPHCEMCRAQYPALISTGERIEPLADALPVIQAPYLVLRSSAPSDKSRPKEMQTCYHVVSFAQRSEVKVGRSLARRGKGVGVHVNESTVSGWHATLRFKDGEFMVEDHESKYGTLLAMQRPLAVASGQALSVRVGRSVFTFSLPQTPATATPTETPEKVVSFERAEVPACSSEPQSSVLPFRRGLLCLLPERLLSCFG